VRPCVAVGLAAEVFPLKGKMPGWDKMSYGWHSDDGKVFTGNDAFDLKPGGLRFGAGDTVGCGIRCDPRKPSSLTRMQIFFTKNGEYMGMAFPRHGPRSTRFSEMNLATVLPFHKFYPVVGLDAPPTLSVEPNFGTSTPFKFDLSRIDDLVTAELTEILDLLRARHITVGSRHFLIDAAHNRLLYENHGWRPEPDNPGNPLAGPAAESDSDWSDDEGEPDWGTDDGVDGDAGAMGGDGENGEGSVDSDVSDGDDDLPFPGTAAQQAPPPDVPPPGVLPPRSAAMQRVEEYLGGFGPALRADMADMDRIEELEAAGWVGGDENSELGDGTSENDDPDLHEIHTVGDHHGEADNGQGGEVGFAEEEMDLDDGR